MYAITEQVGPGVFAIGHYQERLGLLPVIGTAGFIPLSKLGDTFQDSYLKRVHQYWPLVTQSERDSYMQRFWPDQWRYEVEKAEAALEASLASAAL